MSTVLATGTAPHWHTSIAADLMDTGRSSNIGGLNLMRASDWVDDEQPIGG